MKVLAELACARAPTSTSLDSYPQGKTQHAKISSTIKESVHEVNSTMQAKEIQVKKTRNPIKELFERKKEMNERKHQERSKAEATLRELNLQKQRKTKKMKKRQDFPLIRNEYGGLAEKKRRRDGFERKEESVGERIKDIYDFDEDESQIEPSLGTGLSYRNKLERSYEVTCLRAKEFDMDGIVSKAIGETLENGKGDALGARLESMIDRKFKEIEKFAPKTKGALKSFQGEEQQPQITGPMDEFVERKQRSKKSVEQNNIKQMKLKKRSKNFKKKSRNAWYENDSSDEFRTAAKTEDVGVGISKSQRTCSKGKQNLFAELSTSSESEYEENDVDFGSDRHRRKKKTQKKNVDDEEIDQVKIDKYPLENGDEDVDEWSHREKDNNSKNDCDNKKSESEMSDHPLVIDERKDTDEHRQSDDEVDNQSARGFELDDLYREDSSVADSDLDDNTPTENRNTRNDLDQETISLREKSNCETKTNYSREDELIPLEEALDMLDQPEALRSNSEISPENLEDVTCEDRIVIPEITESEQIVDQSEETKEKCKSPIEDQDDELNDELNDDIPELPEKLSTNEKPQKESDNLPLHVFLSRKVQESKKRKQMQLKKLQEEQERLLVEFQPTRRQRKCAIGKQGLLAEISSSDEESYAKDSSKKISEKSDHDKQRKQKKELKEKRKERYLEKKHEQIIAKEQKAIEEEILRELEKKKEILTQNPTSADDKLDMFEQEVAKSTENKISGHAVQKKKHQQKEKQRKNSRSDSIRNEEYPSDSENNFDKSISHSSIIDETIISENVKNIIEQPVKLKKNSKSPAKSRKPKSDVKIMNTNKKGKNSNERNSKNRSVSANGKDSKERKTSSSKRDSDDEELKTTKSWNKVEEGVGVAIGRRKRAAANQLYYWSSSSDEEDFLELLTPVVEEEEDDRQEQHGWIVGDSHKRMITMLAMEKQLKEKRRRSEDEFEPGKTKNKKHRNSTS